MANYKHGELWKSLQNDEELDEADVWDVLSDDKQADNISSEEQPKTTVVSPYTKPYIASKSIQIRRTSTDSSSRQLVQQSAPVKIPDWSKLGNESKTEMGAGEIIDDKLPPHEMVARRQARSHISTFSVTEGAGRTLKGRDLRAVRDAVLRKTGFIE